MIAPTRRRMLLGLPALATMGRVSLAVAAAGTENRLVVVMLRGGLDGLGTVVPIGDPDLRGLRPGLVPPSPGEPGGLLPLNDFFALHPALAGLHRLYRAGEVLPIHAVAPPHRNRSHFDAQDYMEIGASHRLSSGWLNRAAALIPASPAVPAALALGTHTPILLRGPAKVGNWAPPAWQPLSTDLSSRLMRLHARDAVTGPALAEALHERGFTDAVLQGHAPPPPNNPFTVLAERAGLLLAAAEGPRLAALDILGWDTHTSQLARLGWELSRLDEGLMALRAGLGAAWTRTVVLAISEFGRTARENGTGGTDHGTAGVAFLLGGAVAGGRVLADWPGLTPNALFENRDLRPTLDLNRVIRAVLAAHLGLSDVALADVLPESTGAQPMAGLLRG